MSVKFSNNATTELASSIGTSDTSITVVDASKFPILTAGDYTYVTLDTDTASPTREIVKVTAISGNVLTVTRGMDGTSPASFAAGTKVELRLTAALLNDVAGANPSGEPIGFPDKSQTTITFDSGTRTFSITPTGASFDVYCKGVKYTYTAVQLVTIPNTTGLHFIYFSASGVLSTQMSYFTWEEHAPTAYVYWNATTQQAIYFADERHGITLDWQTHEYLHRTRGAAIANGFAASGYTTTGLGATDADAQIDIGGGTFFDEDMQVDIVSTNTPVAGTWQQDLSGPARIPVLYLSGSAWVIDAPTNFPFKVVSGVPQYNLYSGGTWSTASVTNNSYFVSWILATNNLTYPVVSIISQAPTNQVSVAEAMTFEGLNLNGFPSVEFRPLYKVIYQYKDGFANSVKSSTIAVYDLRSISSAGVAAALVQDHGNLSGLTDDDHPQYVHTSEVRTPSAAVKNSFFPSQVGQTGKYLSTDGTNTVWEPAPSGSLSFTGDVTGTGSTGSSVSLTLAASGVVAGQYTKVTVDAKGRVTAGTSVTSSDVTTALGYTPYNATNPAGYTTNVGTVTSVSGTGTVSGLTLTGSVTSSGSLELGGTLSLTSGQVTSALGFTPYNATNPSGYITSSALSSYLPLSGGTVTGNLFVTGTIRSTSGVFQLNDGASTGGGLYFYKTITGSGTSLAPSLFAETGLPLYFMNNGSATPKMTLNTSGELIVTSKVYVGGATVNSGYNGIYGTNMVGAASGNKLVYFFNDGSTLKVDAYDYGTSSPLGFTIGGNGGTVNLYTGATVSGNAILHAGNYGSGYFKTINGSSIIGTGNISVSASVSWDAVGAGTRTGHGDIRFQPPASSYAGIQFLDTSGNGAGWFLIRGTSDTDVYTAEGITLVADKGWLTLAQRETAGKGVRLMSGVTSTERLKITAAGDIQFVNGNSFTYGGNTILHAGNYGSYALPLSGGTVTGLTTFTTSGDAQITLSGGSTTWAGITWSDVNGTDYSWFYGATGTWAFGGGGSAVSGKKMHVHGGMTIGSGYPGTSNPSNGLNVEGAIQQAGNQVLHAANYSSYALPLSGGTLTGLLVYSDIKWSGDQNYGLFGRNAYLDTVNGRGSDPLELNYYDGGPVKIGTGTNGSKSLYAAGIYDSGNQVLHAGNYSSYPLMRYAGLNSGNWQTFTDTSGELRVDQVNDINGGSHSNQPPNVYTYGGVLSWRTDNHSFQLYASHTGDLTFKTQWNNDNYSGWRRILHESNYNSFAPTLTGGNASGTWGINITGNADTVDSLHASSFSRKDTTNQWLKPYYEYTQYLTSETPANLRDQMSSGGGLRVDFMHPSYTGSGGWNHVITWSGYNLYNMYQLGGHYDGGTGTDLWVRSEANHTGTSWTAWRKLLNSSNYNSYSPTLTGGGASGTWGISISGTASYANNVSNGRFDNYSGSYNNVYTWLQFSGNHGLYWPSSGAGTHFTPQGNTYGSWNTQGHRNTYSGLFYDTNAGINGGWMTNGNATGYYAHSYGWKYLHESGVFYIYGGTYGGGSQYTALHSGNYSSYALPLSGGTVSGSIVASGNITAYSDERLKKDWSVLPENFVERLAGIKSGTFTRIDSGARQAGSSAQDWQKLLPEVVSEESDGTLALAYGNAALVSAVELAKELVMLKKELAEIKSRLH